MVAVPVPKLDTAIIHVQRPAPDGTCIIEGDEFHDVDVAVAARKVIVTCEELVSDEYIRRDPTLTRIFGECVSAVVHCPYGAWPSQCYNYYDNDSHALKEYDKASKYQDAEDAKHQLELRPLPRLRSCRCQARRRQAGRGCCQGWCGCHRGCQR